MSSGDLSTQLGGTGSRMSANDLLAVMDAFRRRGTIVSNGAAKIAIQELLGLNFRRDRNRLSERPACES